MFCSVQPSFRGHLVILSNVVRLYEPPWLYELTEGPMMPTCCMGGKRDDATNWRMCFRSIVAARWDNNNAARCASPLLSHQDYWGFGERKTSDEEVVRELKVEARKAQLPACVKPLRLCTLNTYFLWRGEATCFVSHHHFATRFVYWFS